MHQFIPDSDLKRISDVVASNWNTEGISIHLIDRMRLYQQDIGWVLGSHFYLQIMLKSTAFFYRIQQRLWVCQKANQNCMIPADSIIDWKGFANHNPLDMEFIPLLSEEISSNHAFLRFKSSKEYLPINMIQIIPYFNWLV